MGAQVCKVKFQYKENILLSPLYFVSVFTATWSSRRCVTSREGVGSSFALSRTVHVNISGRKYKASRRGLASFKILPHMCIWKFPFHAGDWYEGSMYLGLPLPLKRFRGFPAEHKL